jgi:hypothetical protein
VTQEILELFLQEDCDSHAQKVLEAACSEIGAKITEFTFDRFNVRIDTEMNLVEIDDELNPQEETCTLSIPRFVERLVAQRLS